MHGLTCMFVHFLSMNNNNVLPLAPSSVGTWTLTPPDDPIGWRHLRLKISGPNASGQTHYLSVSGLELYGEIRGLADEDLGGYSVCVCVGWVQCVCGGGGGWAIIFRPWTMGYYCPWYWANSVISQI